MPPSSITSWQLEEKLLAAADDVFKEIETRGELDDAALEKLLALFPRSLDSALEIVDGKHHRSERPAVERFTAKNSGRSFCRVAGNQQSFYVVLARYCSCQAFMNMTLARPESLACKHILAARLARALGTDHVEVVDDTQFASRLLQESDPGPGAGKRRSEYSYD